MPCLSPIRRLPVLHRLGRRRSWILIGQLGIAVGLICLSTIDPQTDLIYVAFWAVFIAFASATQDIAVDAYRIEAVKKEFQAAMSAMYIAGYRIGMLLSGAGGLYLASYFGIENHYSYSAWQTTYLIMAAIMLVGVATTLLIDEPVINEKVEA